MNCIGKSPQVDMQSEREAVVDIMGILERQV